MFGPTTTANTFRGEFTLENSVLITGSIKKEKRRVVDYVGMICSWQKPALCSACRVEITCTLNI